MDIKRIFLCGMPGSGKTTVGEKLARFLGLKFYDLDEVIEKEKRMKVEEIFSKHGEKRFREFEIEIFSKIKNRENCVIALGGGSILNEDILNFINKEENYAFYIETDVKELERRIKKSFVRPVLKNLKDIERLYKKRRAFYEKIKLKADGNKTPEEVVLQILSQLAFNINKKVSERPHKFYIGNIKEFLKTIEEQNLKTFLITHRKIKEIISYYYDISSFEIILVPEGEEAKSLRYFRNVLKSLIDKRADRNSLILGIGGGVIGDLSGFISSVYMRGTRLILVPTTLLAAVDAHLGGKNAVNFLAKNIVGTFKFPEVVFCDPRIFVTLKSAQIIEGFAEILKTALINEKIYSTLKKEVETILSPNLKTYLKWIPLIAKIKLQIVRRDPFELKGERRLLNLGHTIGHVIEASSKYKISHGKAVLMGLKEEIELSKKLGIIDHAFYTDFMELYKRIEYFIGDLDWSHESSFMWLDKKKKAEKIGMFLIKRAGMFEYRDLNVNLLEAYLRETPREKSNGGWV